MSNKDVEEDSKGRMGKEDLMKLQKNKIVLEGGS